AQPCIPSARTGLGSSENRSIGAELAAEPLNRALPWPGLWREGGADGNHIGDAGHGAPLDRRAWGDRAWPFARWHRVALPSQRVPILHCAAATVSRDAPAAGRKGLRWTIRS